MNDATQVERLQSAPWPRPNLFRVNLTGLATIVRKESRRVVRIWVQTIVPPAITMTLYFIIFGSLVGNRIGQMDGVSYTTFIAPGWADPIICQFAEPGVRSWNGPFIEQRIVWLLLIANRGRFLSLQLDRSLQKRSEPSEVVRFAGFDPQLLTEHRKLR